MNHPRLKRSYYVGRANFDQNFLEQQHEIRMEHFKSAHGAKSTQTLIKRKSEESEDPASQPNESKMAKDLKKLKEQ